MAPLEGRPDAQTRARLKEIKLEDIDFEKVKACSDKHTVKRYIQLIEEDGSYFTDLLKACKDKLLQIDPKEYFLLYPRVASEQEVDEATRDLLDWQEAVRETDDALRNSKKDRIWDEQPFVVPVPVRGQDPVVSRPNLPTSKVHSTAPPAKKNDVFARDKTQMKDYYSAWDKVDVDALEAELDREERELEESRKKHFEDLREQQADAQATSEIGQGAAPESVPKAHWGHLADSEKEKGNEAFYAKDYAEAEAYYSRSIHFRADDPSSWANRALVRLKLERPSEALEDCEHALALNPRYMKALHRKGKALYELRRYEEAVRFIQLALRESPGNTQINGDLMVARRQLRNSTEVMSEEKPRRVDAEPTCRVEELPDEPPRTAGPAPGYTRVQIEEDSDSDGEPNDGGNAGPAPASGSASKERSGFHKVVIEEVSDSEDETPAPAEASSAPPSVPAAPVDQPSSAAASAPVISNVDQPPSAAASGDAGSSSAPSSTAADGTTFHKIKIVEVSDSEDEELLPRWQGAGEAIAPPAAAPAAAQFTGDVKGRVFAPPQRSREQELPVAPPPVLCFDDMD